LSDGTKLGRLGSGIVWKRPSAELARVTVGFSRCSFASGFALRTSLPMLLLLPMLVPCRPAQSCVSRHAVL
jgi:hypothetical protein